MTEDLPLVSASQIELFVDCERKWGFRYIDGDKPPPHPSAALGTEVQDTQLDPYLSEGRAFDFTRPSGEIALAISKLLPAPKSPGLQLRRKFLMPSPTGRFVYRGEFDLAAKDSGIIPGLEGGRFLLGDIKTTGNLAYAKTPELLSTDIQAQLYSTVVMFEEGVNELDVVWFYGRTRKPHRSQREFLKVRLVEERTAMGELVAMSTASVVGQFRRIEESASRLVTIKLANPKAQDLRPNPRMCDAYGGCPYRFKCNLSPAVHSAAINEEAVVMEAKTNDFLAGLRKSIPAQNNLTPTTGRIDIPADPPAPAALPAWATAPVDPLHVRKAAPPAINPPEAALPPAPPVGIAAPAAAAEAPKRGRKAAKVEDSAAIPATEENIAEIVAFMKRLGIKSLALDGANLDAIELV
jgi:hypothetical protein